MPPPELDFVGSVYHYFFLLQKESSLLSTRSLVS